MKNEKTSRESKEMKEETEQKPSRKSETSELGLYAGHIPKTMDFCNNPRQAKLGTIEFLAI